uniref:Uncharacterized protein n=1 Tax=Physcomitrium patens TaxID=3218 RepID=A0A2K1KG91_PHYPA|nr:hypothetical protein PHYPA_009158 [Physcomitrium patens]
MGAVLCSALICSGREGGLLPTSLPFPQTRAAFHQHDASGVAWSGQRGSASDSPCRSRKLLPGRLAVRQPRLLIMRSQCWAKPCQSVSLSPSHSLSLTHS